MSYLKVLEILALCTERAAFLILTARDFTNHGRLALCINLSTQSQFTEVWVFWCFVLLFFLGMSVWVKSTVIRERKDFLSSSQAPFLWTAIYLVWTNNYSQKMSWISFPNAHFMLWIQIHRPEFHKVLKPAYNSKWSVHSLALTQSCVLCLSAASHCDPLWTPPI